MTPLCCTHLLPALFHSPQNAVSLGAENALDGSQRLSLWTRMSQQRWVLTVVSVSSYCQLESLTHSSLATVVVVSVFYCQDSKGSSRLVVTIKNINNAKTLFKYLFKMYTHMKLRFHSITQQILCYIKASHMVAAILRSHDKSCCEI